MEKKEMLDPIWLAPLGQTLYETVNPFWAFCQAGGRAAGEVILFHDAAAGAPAEAAARAFAVVGRELTGKAPSVTRTGFDDENPGEFREKARAVFARAETEGRFLWVDISPTTWNYVPVLLMEMARRMPEDRVRVNYLQYAAHDMRRTPYALIPRMGAVLRDLTDLCADAGGKP